jgi:hypothetical protein
LLGHPLNSIKGLKDLEEMNYHEDVINPKDCMILNAIHKEKRRQGDSISSSC